MPSQQSTPPAPARAGSAGQAARQLLTFNAGEQLFGVDIGSIKAIIQYGAITRVPMAPPHIRGVLNLRGAVVPVIDLMARLGGAAATPGKRACIVIVEVAQEGMRQDVGILVDAVSEVLDVEAANIEPPPAFGAGVRPDFMRCLARVGQDFVIVLDVDRLFSLEDLAQVFAEPVAA